MLLFILLIIIAIVGYGLYYIGDYYHSEVDIQKFNNSDVNIKTTSNGLLLDSYGNNTALIFYPGAKVEYTSYIPLLDKLAENGVDCFIVEMPFNIAMFGKDNAGVLMSNNSYNYTNWYLAGHSLGGAMVTEYASNHEENVNAIILLSSYSTTNISVPVLSIMASEDHILNKKNYEINKKNIHSNFTEYVIEGGNHAQFASFGNQKGDGIASISAEEQKNLTANKILSFINLTSK